MQKGTGYKSLQVLFFALMAGQVAFLLVAYYLVSQGVFVAGMKQLENIMMPILIILSLVCMISGNKIFKRKQQQLGNIPSLSSRFSEYRSACLVRWALLEGCCLFAVICFMLTSNNLFILIAALLLFIFGASAPVKNKVAADMGISTDELDSIS